MHIIKNILKVATAMTLALLCSCEELERIESQIEDLETRVDSLETAISAINNNTIAVQALLRDQLAILEVTYSDEGYVIQLSDGSSIEIIDGLNVRGIMPVIGIDKDGDWIISMDNGETFDKLANSTVCPDPAVTPLVRVNAEGHWEISIDKGKTWSVMTDQNKRPVSAVDGKEVARVKTFFSSIGYNEESGLLEITLADGRALRLNVEGSFVFELAGYTENQNIFFGDTLSYTVSTNDVEEVSIIVPEGWKATFNSNVLSITCPETGETGIYETTVIVVSSKGYLKYIKVRLTLAASQAEEGAVDLWNDFVDKKDSNILLDFSYAGFRHGEEAPLDATDLGYKVYRVTNPKYGAIPDDGKSDRQAFLKALEDAFGTPVISANSITFPHRPEAYAMIYFPEGEYILHDESDDTEAGSQSIIIRAGHFAIKGDGRNKTRLVMAAPMQPADENVLYSSPDMIQLKHNSTFASYPLAVYVIEDAKKGDFNVKVSSASILKEGDWVCLHVKNNSAEFVAKELAPYTCEANWEIGQSGVEVIDYHQIKAIKGNEVTFYEPLHHEVEASMNWEIKEYPHYEYVGVEDLTFVGNAKSDFQHHGSWEDDGAYKPISLNRVTDSWIRRVNFESVSEACSIVNSANVSAYDIQMTGVQGHAAVRSQASSRVLIAATTDSSADGAGNWHGVGVSRQSIGTVLWRNVWGDDSCFESHATQPRATLIDCCSGGWHREHQGGDSNLAPNHLADLTIWNFTATKVSETDFRWWGTESEPWWKFLPPIIVGFQSATPVTFSTDDTKAISFHNETPDPESLYEAQLKNRLGYVPAWLNELK